MEELYNAIKNIEDKISNIELNIFNSNKNKYLLVKAFTGMVSAKIANIKREFILSTLSKEDIDKYLNSISKMNNELDKINENNLNFTISKDNEGNDIIAFANETIDENKNEETDLDIAAINAFLNNNN